MLYLVPLYAFLDPIFQKVGASKMIYFEYILQTISGDVAAISTICSVSNYDPSDDPLPWVGSLTQGKFK